MNKFISIVQLLCIEFVYFAKKPPGADALVPRANYRAVCKLGCHVQIRVPCANEKKVFTERAPTLRFWLLNG